MRRRLSSPRFRRRLAWTTSVVVVLGAIVAGAIVVGNTGHSTETPLTNQPAWVYHEPKLHTLSKAERLDLHRFASFDAVDVIITDPGVDGPVLDALRAQEIEVVLA
jgi:hypothetical protein